MRPGEATAVFVEVMGTGMGGAVGDAFRKMGVAEEELAAAAERYPRETWERVNDVAFALLCPNDLLRTKSDDVYAAHCRELIDRVAAGASDRALAEATDAECLALVMAQATKAPLTREYAALAHRLFCKLLGDKVARLLEVEDDYREAWPGELDELLSEARGKLRGRTGREV